jgi:urea transport system ATP-binding protein
VISLRFESVVVDFDGFKALDGVDFVLAPGQLRFLIGPNGAGKTSFIDVLTGLTRPTSGRILIDERDVTTVAAHRRVALGVGRSFQTPTIFEGLTVFENLDLATTNSHGVVRLLARRGRITDSIEAVLDRVGLADRAHHAAGTLGHGGRRWLEIAMLLIQEPRMLLFDEPAAGMSQSERTRLGALLVELADAGHTVLVVEHDMAFMRRYAQRVTVLHQGRVITEGSVDDVQNDPLVREVYLGRSREERTGARPLADEAVAEGVDR